MLLFLHSGHPELVEGALTVKHERDSSTSLRSARNDCDEIIEKDVSHYTSPIPSTACSPSRQKILPET